MSELWSVARCEECGRDLCELHPFTTPEYRALNEGLLERAQRQHQCLPFRAWIARQIDLGHVVLREIEPVSLEGEAMRTGSVDMSSDRMRRQREQQAHIQAALERAKQEAQLRERVRRGEHNIPFEQYVYGRSQQATTTLGDNAWKAGDAFAAAALRIERRPKPPRPRWHVWRRWARRVLAREPALAGLAGLFLLILASLGVYLVMISR